MGFDFWSARLVTYYNYLEKKKSLKLKIPKSSESPECSIL